MELEGARHGEDRQGQELWDAPALPPCLPP